MKETIPDWAKEIIGKALVDIQCENDIKRVIEEVKGTPLSVQINYMKTFLKLVEMKRQLILKK